jgi:DUF1009 family protein
VARKLGILAGGGVLPQRLVEACRSDGRDVFVLAFEGQTAVETTREVDHAWVRLGAFGAALEILRGAAVDDLVMAGPMRRPSIAELRPDKQAIKMLARAGTRAFGDDGLLRVIIGALEAEGFHIVGVDDVIDDITAKPGPLGQVSPDDSARLDIARGVDVLRALGAVDVGQAVVVQEGIVLGIEAAEGTDGLLARCAALRREGLGGVLVKLRKAGQDNRADLPTIGPETILGARDAGLRGVAVEAGATLVLSRVAAIQAADRSGLFLVAISVPE